MKFQLERLEGLNRFTGHGPGYVEVNGRRITGNVVVAGSTLEEGWIPARIDSLTSDAIGALVRHRPELVLIGTGESFRFPPRALFGPLQEAGVGVEVMNTPAACRTFNILLGEGRAVVAALVVE